MDYDVPSVEKVIEDARTVGGDNYCGYSASAEMVAKQWELWEALDERALGFLNEAVEQLNRIKDAVQAVMTDDGEYDRSDRESAGEQPEPETQELARYAYHDQSSHPGDYVATRLPSPVNGDNYGVFVVRHGQPIEEPCPIYSTGATEAEARELAYRFANDLPKPHVLYSGDKRTGVSKKTAQAWLSKNRSRFDAYELKVAPYGQAFGVYGTPSDWGQLIN